MKTYFCYRLRWFYTRRNVTGMSWRHCFFCSSTCVKVLCRDFPGMSIPLKSKNHFNFFASKKCRFLFRPILSEYWQDLGRVQSIFLSITILFHQMQPYHFIYKLKNVPLTFQLTFLINFWLCALLKYSILHLVSYVATMSFRNRLA